MIREIPYELPREIFETARERYWDTATGKHIAIKKVKYKGRMREMAVAYDQVGEHIVIITIHPLKVLQKMNRVTSRRWQKI